MAQTVHRPPLLGLFRLQSLVHLLLFEGTVAAVVLLVLLVQAAAGSCPHRHWPLLLAPPLLLRRGWIGRFWRWGRALEKRQRQPGEELQTAPPVELLPQGVGL